MEDITDLIAKYDAVQGATNKLSVTFLSTLLRELRKSKLRRPDIVLACWDKVLPKESGAEIWNLYEQIFVAGLDEGELELADECLKQLVKKFPDSIRVGRLVGLQKEQEGEYGDALEIYKGLLERNPSNLMVLKRKVCVYKAMGDVKAEVEELNKLLRQFPADVSSWQELAEIYLSLCDYEAAAHCFEELVLLAPRNAHFHVRLAESYYSVGQYEHYMLSRKHFSISLTLQGPQHNLRALYGLLSACKSMLTITTPTNSNADSSSSSSSNSSKVVVDSPGGNSNSSSTTTNNNNSTNSSSKGALQQIDYELENRIARELQAWAVEQLSSLAAAESRLSGSYNSSSSSSSSQQSGPIETVQKSLL